MQYPARKVAPILFAKSICVMPGLFLRLTAMALITAMSATIHGLAQSLPIGQIVFWRSAVALIPIAAYLWLRGQLRNGLKTRNPKGHILRSAFGCLSMVFSFVSLAYLPVANASARAYLTPLITLPLASVMLANGWRAGWCWPVFWGLSASS